MTRAEPLAVRRALAQRLRAVAGARDLVVQEHDDPAADAAGVLAALVDDARSAPTLGPTWLLLVALGAAYPTDADVRATRRRLVLDSPGATMMWLLGESLHALRHSDPLLTLEVVRGGVVVDVDYTARHDLNTGIQRVVRRTVPIWDREHDLTLAAWNAGTALRRLVPAERSRVLAWDGPLNLPPSSPRAPSVLVPWESAVVLPEVPAPHLCAPLAAMAEHSGNTLSLVGYDAIPVVSADLMPPVEPERFSRYLTVVKHSTRVSAISESAAEEFRGFVDMLGSQGLVGPDVSSSLLPVEVPPTVGTGTARTDVPLVLVVGSHEPRKNHLAVLHAAERLWRAGARMRLQFIGGSSWASSAFDTRVDELRSAGRDIVVGRAVRDEDLWRAYREARFTVFPSLHEGYGLPVAESLGVGTPAITSSYGSTQEIARDGGVLLVDPRSDDDLLDAMRRLLEDDDLLGELRAAALARPARTWADYPRDPWGHLVGAPRPDDARGPDA